MTTVVIILGLLVGVLIFLLFRKQNTPPGDAVSALLKQDLTEISRGMSELKESLGNKIDIRLEKSQASMGLQLESSAKLIKDVTERLTKLDETNKRVVDVADELKQLQNVLQNPKQRGVLGEFYLEQILQNLLPPGSYELQYKLAEGFIVDAVIILEGKMLPIDSKFSLENYNRLIDAKGSERLILERSFKDDLKKRIDETARYIQPKRGTLEQAFMFIPSEAIYYDLLANKVGAAGVNGRDLLQYAVRDKKVTIVGPSTLSVMLLTIVEGMRSHQIQKDFEVIRKNIEQLSTHLIAYDGHFKKVGNSLGATVGHYNSASKELARIDKDIVKIAATEASIDPLLLDRPNLED
ncbi:DNA recombination protein RmuC [Candidatus Saccharibacteria bacterium]|nr:DNA recombination protein RmuC [Candidatus Saccharibacteria bacterium]